MKGTNGRESVPLKISDGSGHDYLYNHGSKRIPIAQGAYVIARQKFMSPEPDRLPPIFEKSKRSTVNADKSQITQMSKLSKVSKVSKMAETSALAEAAYSHRVVGNVRVLTDSDGKAGKEKQKALKMKESDDARWGKVYKKKDALRTVEENLGFTAIPTDLIVIAN